MVVILVLVVMLVVMMGVDDGGSCDGGGGDVAKFYQFQIFLENRFCSNLGHNSTAKTIGISKM